jgi:hypothetical protein
MRASSASDWWPATTRLLIRRVRLDPGLVSADPRSRRRRTLHPAQRALPIPGLAGADVIYGYSFILFILTNLDVSAPDKAAAAGHWYRHRATIENIFRDSKLGAALRHLPSGYTQVNTAWMWARCWPPAWPGGCTSSPPPPAARPSWTVTGSAAAKAMIATLRWRLIAVPGRLVRLAGQLTLRLPPGSSLLGEVLARLQALPATS